MTTISTKQLRDNMAAVVRDLQAGKSVQLSYRHTVIGLLSPSHESAGALRRGSANGVGQFLRTADFGPIPRQLQQTSKSFKQEIAELRNRDLDTK